MSANFGPAPSFNYGVCWRACNDNRTISVRRSFHELDEITRHLLALDPDDLDYQSSVLSCAINWAATLRDQQRYAEVAEVLTNARSKVPAMQTSNRLVDQARWMMTSGLLSDVLRGPGELAEAETICREALKQWEDLNMSGEVSDFRTFAVLRSELLEVYGYVLSDQGRWPGAERVLRDALQQRQKLLPLGKTPREFAFAAMSGEIESLHRDPHGESDYADLQRRLSDVLAHQDKLADAETLCDEAARTCYVLAAIFPDALKYRRVRARALDQLSTLNWRQDKLAQGEHTVARWRQLVSGRVLPAIAEAIGCELFDWAR